MKLIDTIEDRRLDAFTNLLEASPELALASLKITASRGDAMQYFLKGLNHQLYTGDTALHAAATVYDIHMVSTLLSFGAEVQAKNRRGAQPIHYSCDGDPLHKKWNADAQAATTKLLIKSGAHPDAVDSNGATPLHRAVRQRCTGAVLTLIENGASVKKTNRNGSTALHLAVQNTGRSGSGTDQTIVQQKAIIDILLSNGSSLSDIDAKGKTVFESIESNLIRTWIKTRYC